MLSICCFMSDIVERFKTVLREQIDRREAANKDITDNSEIENTLQSAASECQQHPWKPRPPSLRPSTRSGAMRPSTAPAGAADQGYNKQTAPPKTAPPELKKSPSILQLQADRDRYRRVYYEQVLPTGQNLGIRPRFVDCPGLRPSQVDTFQVQTPKHELHRTNVPPPNHLFLSPCILPPKRPAPRARC
jgi:hypothetical protein